MSMSVQSLQSYNFTRLKDANAEALQGKAIARLSPELTARTGGFALMVSQETPSVAQNVDSVSLSAEAQKSLESQSKTMHEYTTMEAWKAAREKEGVFEKYQEAGDKVALPSEIRLSASSGKWEIVDAAETKADYGNYFVNKMEDSITQIMSNLQGWRDNTLRAEELSHHTSGEQYITESMHDSESRAGEQFGNVVKEFNKLTDWASENGVEEDAQQFFAEYTEKYYGQKLDLGSLGSIVAQAT